MTVRRTLVLLGIALFAVAFWIALFLAPQVVGIVVAALLALCMIVDVARHVRSRDDDCGYDSTLFGAIESAAQLDSRVVHTPAVARTVIDGGKRAVWPNEAGAPE